jgi:hypothetical protein
MPEQACTKRAAHGQHTLGWAHSLGGLRLLALEPAGIGPLQGLGIHPQAGGPPLQQGVAEHTEAIPQLGQFQAAPIARLEPDALARWRCRAVTRDIQASAMLISETVSRAWI